MYDSDVLENVVSSTNLVRELIFYSRHVQSPVGGPNEAHIHIFSHRSLEEFN